MLILFYITGNIIGVYSFNQINVLLPFTVSDDIIDELPSPGPADMMMSGWMQDFGKL